jgi:hypothetical protein
MRRAVIFLLLLLPVLTAAEPPGDGSARYGQALKDFYAENYEAAESGFDTVYRLWPEARFAPDAAFKAGETAFRAERFDAATVHLAHYLRAYPHGPAAPEARERLAQAQAKRGPDAPLLPLADVKRTWRRPLVAWLDTLPAADNAAIDRLFRALQSQGYRAVALPVYKTPAGPPLSRQDDACLAGAYFATEAAPVCADRLADMVVAAHRAGLRIVAIMPVRDAVLGADELYPSQRWDTYRREVVADPTQVDLWRPEITARLETLARDVALTGPDAIWFGPDNTFLPDEALTPGALDAVERKLGAPLDATALFAAMPAGGDGRIRRGVASVELAAFCEERSARLAKTIDAMAAAVRAVHRSCRLGVTVPAAALDDPVAGLRDSAVDVDALRGKGRDVVLRLDYRLFKVARKLTEAVALARLETISRRLVAAAGASDRGVIALHTDQSGGQTMPRWQVADCVARLFSAGAFGLALNPPLRGANPGELLIPRSEP